MLFICLANFCLGAAIVWCWRRSPALQDSLFCWQLLALGLYEALILTPVATYLLRFYPQWTLHYGWDPQIHPNLEGMLGWLSWPAIFGLYLAAFAGFGLTRLALLRQSPSLTLAPLAAGAGLWLLALLRWRRQFAYIGTFDDFSAGQADLWLLHLAGWVHMALYLSAVTYVVLLQRTYGSRDPRFL